MPKNIVVVGGGASGFMAAITAAEQNPAYKIIILEKNREVLGKVKISGGGRCNVTNIERNTKKFAKNYPRGSSFILNLFKQFDQGKTVQWFDNKGVKLKSELDGRIFPISNTSETIIECLLGAARKNNIEIRTSSGVKFINKVENNSEARFNLELFSGEKLSAYSILYAAGGSPNISSYLILQSFDIQVNSPVPSLFTFTVPNSNVVKLAGLSVNKTKVRVVGQKLDSEGPLLITHWGFSAPAILKLSAWGARIFADVNYKFKILISWVNHLNFNEILFHLEETKKTTPKKKIQSNPLFQLPSRLWIWLCELSEIEQNLVWLDISNKKKNKLIENIINCGFDIDGKSTFKEEFVTCGGVDLSEVWSETLESKKVPGLFFSGEVLDIDAVTGGFNFQAAWTTGYVVGKNIAK